MDLFEQIDQFEKMANELADKLEEGMAEDAEIVEDLDVADRRAAAQARLVKLAKLARR
jgi:hypothetical protein